MGARLWRMEYVRCIFDGVDGVLVMWKAVEQKSGGLRDSKGDQRGQNELQQSNRGGNW